MPDNNEPTPDQFRELLRSTAMPTNTLAALDASRIVRLPPDTGKENYAARIGARPGVPFDTQTGVPFMARLRDAFSPTAADEIKALENAYGKGNVRKNDFGWLIVTHPDDHGKTTDYLVDPVGIDLGDLSTAMAAVPEIVGGIGGGALASKLLKNAPAFVRTAGVLVGMAGGTAVAGGVKDILDRAAEGQPLQPGEVATRRGEGAVLDLSIGAGLGAATKAAQYLVSPFSGSTGPLQLNAKVAKSLLNTKYGLDLELSPAESTGSSFLQRVEGLEAQKPGASTWFDIFQTKRESQIEQLRTRALGGAVPDEEAAGRRAIAALGAKVAPLEQSVERSAYQTGQAATSELLSGTGPQIDTSLHGASIRTRAEELRNEFRQQRDALYSAVYSDPRTAIKNIAGDPLATEADAMLKRLPTVQKQVPSPIVGAPPTTTDVLLKEFVEPGVEPKLRALQQARGQQFRLDELQQMRTAVDNDIAQGEAVPGVQTRQLTQIRKMLTDRIQQGLDSIDPALRKQWETANDFVAQNVGRFKQAGIADLFRVPEQGGYVGNSEIVERVMGKGGQDTYATYKQFFGANSPEIAGIQQAVRDSVLSKSSLSPSIDAAGFVRRLEALPEPVLADAFGPNAAKLRASARALQVAQGDKLSSTELQQALQSGNVSADSLRQMISDEATRDAAFRNELLRDAAKGNIGPDKLKPTELVNRFVFNKSTTPGDLAEVTTLLRDRPDVLEDLRRLTFQRALDDATTVSRGTGRRIVMGDDLETLLKDENTRKRLRTAMGEDTYSDLMNLKGFLKAGSAVQQAAKSAGGLSAGMQISGLLSSGVFKYLDKAAQNFVLAAGYTSKPLRKFLSNTAFDSQDAAAAMNVLIASTPFLEAVTKTYNQAGARAVVGQFKDAIDRYVKETPGTGLPEPSPDDFRKSLRQP